MGAGAETKPVVANMVLLVIDGAATLATTDVSVKGKQHFLRSTHFTEIALPRADLREDVRREEGKWSAHTVVKRVFS